MDVFLNSFFIHIVYLVIKLFSIGMWSFTQVDLRTSAIWLFPLGICLIIIVVILRWFTAIRKWLLALVIIVSLVSWTAILIIRVDQINDDVSQLSSEIHDSSIDEKKLLSKQLKEEVSFLKTDLP